MRRATGDACGRSTSSRAGGAAAGAAGAAARAVSSMLPMTSPGCTVSPSRAVIRASTPPWSAATSTLTFSVSSDTSGSPASTRSPSRFSQAPTVASTTDSPSVGTRTSTGMGWHSLEDFGQDASLLGGVRFRPPLRRAGPLGTSDVPQLARATHLPLDEIPGAHVFWLLLEPDDLARRCVVVQH